MAFVVLNTLALDRFVKKHRDAQRALSEWLDTVRSAAWSNLAELRQTYPAADGVPVQIGGGQTIVVTVFNIRGNRYRLITVVNYAMSVCRVADVLTHEEYSTDRWKDRL